MKLLIVDCCIRENLSSTRKLYEAFLEKVDISSFEVERLYLTRENLQPLTNDDINLRDKLLKEKNYEHDIFKYAKQFAEATEIIIAAPYWDLSFPSLLRVYFERVSVAGITFGYEGTKSVGYCKAETIDYFSTCGGFVDGEHLGAEYVRKLAKMFGIDVVREYIVEGLDVNPEKRNEIANYFK
jgi:FMN-dependent NADH-azoreductase